MHLISLLTLAEVHRLLHRHRLGGYHRRRLHRRKILLGEIRPPIQRYERRMGLKEGQIKVIVNLGRVNQGPRAHCNSFLFPQRHHPDFEPSHIKFHFFFLREA